MQGKLFKITKVLNRRGLNRQYERYLYSSETVISVIEMVNEGKIGDALIYSQMADEMLGLIRDDLISEDLNWYVDIAETVKKSILAAQYV